MGQDFERVALVDVEFSALDSARQRLAAAAEKFSALVSCGCGALAPLVRVNPDDCRGVAQLVSAMRNERGRIESALREIEAETERIESMARLRR